MRKYLFGVLAMLMVVLMTASKCGSDPVESNAAIGTWVGSEGKDRVTVVFKSDGTGTATMRYYDSYSGTEIERSSFTYKMLSSSRGICILQESSSYGYSYSYSDSYGSNLYVVPFEIEGKTMYLFEDQDYNVYNDYDFSEVETVLIKQD